MDEVPAGTLSLRPPVLGYLGMDLSHLAANPDALEAVFLLSQDLNSLGTPAPQQDVPKHRFHNPLTPFHPLLLQLWAKDLEKLLSFPFSSASLCLPTWVGQREESGCTGPCLNGSSPREFVGTGSVLC